MPSGGQIFWITLPPQSSKTFWKPPKHLVAEGVVGGHADHGLEAVLARPFAERVVRLRARPAGAHDVRVLFEVALREVVGCRDREHVHRLQPVADGRDGVAGGGEQAADQQVHVVLARELLGLAHADRRLAFLVLDDEGHFRAGEVALLLVEIHLEAVLHVLADLREDPGHRREEADFELLGKRRTRGQGQRGPDDENLPVHAFPPLKSPMMPLGR